MLSYRIHDRHLDDDLDPNIAVERTIHVRSVYPGEVVRSFEEFERRFPDAGSLDVDTARRMFLTTSNLYLNVVQIVR